MKKVATIILNRNLPTITDKLFNLIKKFNNKYTDIFIVDSGSLKKNKSKKTTWSANWKMARKNGLRFGRGMNFGLYSLFKEKKFDKYDYYFLITNDTVVQRKPFINKLVKIMDKEKKIAILSPCSKKWGEKHLLRFRKLKFFWYIHNNAYFIRKNFIHKIKNTKNGYMNFLFDGNNFRGFGADSELILKAYKNNMGAAITSEVWLSENESYLLNKNMLIKTEPFDKNLKLYVKEGLYWMKKKYKFKTRWDMHLHVKKYYDSFFKKNKRLLKYSL